jgi:D-lactate dehydrogenase (cytochrome)
MTNEGNLRRFDFVTGRQFEFDSLCQDILKSIKDESSRNLNLKPSTKFQDIYNTLSQYFGYEGVSYLNDDRKIHGQDISINPLAIPDIVVYPRKVEQIQWLVSFASQHEIPLTPYGNGSSIQSSIVASHGGITVDVSKMNEVLEFHPDDHEIRVQAGITKNALTDYLKGSNLFLPIDTGCDASIAGLISTNASGSGAFYYGGMKSFVLSMKIVSPDGNIISTGEGARKRSVGYDLNSLFIGAEGTLGIVVEVVLKLQTVPKAVGAAFVSFNSLEDTLSCAVKLIQQGISLQKCELMDMDTIRAVNKFHSTTFPLKHYIFLESHGNSRESVDLIFDDCKDICREGGMDEFSQFTDESVDVPMIWKAKSTAWTCIARSGKGVQIAVIDVAVPLSKFSELALNAKKDFKMMKIEYSPLISHFGDGAVYFIIPVHFNDRDAVRQVELVASRISQRAIQLEGTCSASNGIGSVKRELLAAELGIESIKLMRNIKSALDPKNIMNPGKVFVSFESSK